VNARASRHGTLPGAAGNRIAWEAFDGGAPLSVVLSHGGGQTRHAWRRAALRLQDLGVACLTFDKRGHGESDWSAAGEYGLHDFKADFDRILAHWNRPCVLVGASLGGIVSLMSAADAPPCVRGLVMVDTAPELNPAELARLVEFLGGDGALGFESPDAAARHVRRYFPEREVSAEAVASGLAQSADRRWHWRWDVRVVLGSRNSIALPHEAELHACARAVRVPFLLIRAGRSRLVTDAAVGRLRECAPQLEVLGLEDADHIVGGADAARVADLIGPFLARCAAAPLRAAPVCSR
jgi:pimeloyl-ACP methyl ester carboxylesterase